MPAPLDVPVLVRQRARANGRSGHRWLEALPDLVDALAARWDLDVGRSLHGGTASFVAEATDAGGRACVLKVAMALETDADDAFARSVWVHRFAAGDGCAELLDFDEAAPAMLLERLGPNLDELGLPVPQLLDVVASTLRSFWRPVPADCPLPTGAEQAAWLAAYITSTWDRLDRPCPSGVIEQAVTCCELRAAAFDPAAAVLVHGDAHGWNTLEADGGHYKFVDPEGLRSSPEHDLAVAMREYNELLLAGDTARLVRERAEHLASSCGADPEAVWQWGYVERVSTGLANLQDFDGPAGQGFLEVAARTPL